MGKGAILAILALVILMVVGLLVDRGRHRASKYNIARLTAQKLALEAFPKWRSRNPGKACPDAIGELGTFMDGHDMNDPWGQPVQDALRAGPAFRRQRHRDRVVRSRRQGRHPR